MAWSQEVWSGVETDFMTFYISLCTKQKIKQTHVWESVCITQEHTRTRFHSLSLPLSSSPPELWFPAVTVAFVSMVTKNTQTEIQTVFRKKQLLLLTTSPTASCVHSRSRTCALQVSDVSVATPTCRCTCMFPSYIFRVFCLKFGVLWFQPVKTTCSFMF